MAVICFWRREVDERNYRLLQGYKRAGDILIQRALADPYDRDNLVFPAIFNYRHYIELALKAIIEEHGPFAGVSLGPKNHKLIELWLAIRQGCGGVWLRLFGCDGRGSQRLY